MYILLSEGKNYLERIQIPENLFPASRSYWHLKLACVSIYLNPIALKMTTTQVLAILRSIGLISLISSFAAEEEARELSEKQKEIVDEMMEKRWENHYRSRSSPYPETQVMRFPVPDNKVSWQVGLVYLVLQL